jgi:hypothetical protein
MFERFSKEAGKEQYLIPYFIAAHPGTTDEDMLEPGAVAQAQRLPPRPGADLPADAAGAGHGDVAHGKESAAQGDAASREKVAVVRSGLQRAACTRPSCATTIRKTGRCCARPSRAWAAPT